MYEFVIRPPVVILIAATVIALAGAIAVVARKDRGTSTWVGLGVAVVAAFAIIAFLYRPVTIRVDQDAVSILGPGGAVLPWEEVTSAVYAADLRNSPWRPTVRTSGIALGDYRSGRFLLSNGRSARVFTEQTISAVIIQTADAVFLIAPHQVIRLRDAVDVSRTIHQSP